MLRQFICRGLKTVTFIFKIKNGVFPEIVFDLFLQWKIIANLGNKI